MLEEIAQSAAFTFAFGINNAGQVVGEFRDASGDHGFLFSGGAYTALDVPGATSTVAEGINDLGQIAGFFTDAGGTTHGFLLSGGVFTTVDFPGATSTQIFALNNAGQLVGAFDDAATTHGFLATPQQVAGVPEPTTLALFGLSALGLIGYAWRPRRSGREKKVSGVNGTS